MGPGYMGPGFAFFRHVKARRTPSLLKRALRNLDSGQFTVPPAFNVLSRFPMEESRNMRPRPLKLQLPENQLMQAFYKQHPEARLEPVALQSSHQPLAKQFALRQLQLMRTQSMSADRAFAQVQRELGLRIRELRSQRGGITARLGLVQQDEALALAEGLEAVAQQKKQQLGLVE